jgi:dimethylargininase
MLIALTRAVPPSINRCELTHLARSPIEYANAVREHDEYERLLASLGCRVERLPETPDLADSVFVEDAAVVLDELAVITRPGAESRRAETRTVEEALGRYRRLAFVEAPGTLDGGDVLHVGRRLFVGRTPRSTEDGARQLAAIVAPSGYTVEQVDVTGCLHLKSAVTLARHDPPLLLVNPEWVDPESFGTPWLSIDPSESFAANVLLIAETIVCAAEFPKTRSRLESRGMQTAAVAAGELAKAEGGLTCGSIVFRGGATGVAS